MKRQRKVRGLYRFERRHGERPAHEGPVRHASRPALTSVEDIEAFVHKLHTDEGAHEAFDLDDVPAALYVAMDALSFLAHVLESQGHHVHLDHLRDEDARAAKPEAAAEDRRQNRTR